MATASLRERFRSARTYSRNRSEFDEDAVHLDPNKDASENMYEILRNFCQKQGITDGRRVAYLNLIIKLFEDIKSGQILLSISKRDIICCLRVGLVSSNTAVRASTLRVLRHCIVDTSDVLIINKLQIPHLIARSIDLVLKSDHERIQALRLSLKMLTLAPKLFPPAITRSLISLVNGANEQKDKMIYASLFLLCELCVLNPDQAIECTAEVCILRSCLDVSLARVNECLVGCLLFLLNKPETRSKVNFQLDFLASAYCDMQRIRETESTLFTCSRLSMLAALRTWTGVFHLCSPNNIGGIKAIINMLTLPDPELRKATLDLLYDIFGLDMDEQLMRDPETATSAINPSRPQDSWRIVEGFVVSEGKDVLPHFADTRPNLTEVHTALLIYSFLECDLLSALVEVVVHADAFLSTLAIMLIGFLLNSCHKLLANELLEFYLSLPSLMNYSTDSSPHRKMRAITAMHTLHKVHKLMMAPPKPTSLFLRCILMQGSSEKKSTSDDSTEERHQKKVNKRYRLLARNVESHDKEYEILSRRDPRDWDWDHITALLKYRNESFLRLEDVHIKVIIRKLVNFYMPAKNQYSSYEYSLKFRQHQHFTLTAFSLLDMFLACPAESDCGRLMDELIRDICTELKQIVGGSSAHDCLLSPSRVSSTLSQHYFLIIGYLTNSELGLVALERSNGLKILFDIVESTHHDIYIKLIVSSLCYTTSAMTRKILTSALTSSIDNVRVYATELLLIHARAGVPQFHKWGLELLIPQIYDANKMVANASVDILHELCHDPVILDCLVESRPSLLHLRDKGDLLLIRFLSTVNGFQFLSTSSFLENELEKWEKGYNYRYVGLLEAEIHDSLTLHQRGENGRYTRRLTNARHRWKAIWVPPHLYGELSRHYAGFAVLANNSCVNRMVQKIHSGSCESDLETLDLKASLWALSNMATSQLGFEFLQERHLLQAIADIATNSPVLTVRATAFYCLSLIATTEAGADALANIEWYSVRHRRTTRAQSDSVETMREPRSFCESDVTSSVSQDLEEGGESVENLSQFLDCPLPHSPLTGTRASTLPPGLSGDFSGTEQLLSPGTSQRRHQRSYSETASLLHNQSFETPKRMSFQDAAGLATLQLLQASRRPEKANLDAFLDCREPRTSPPYYRSISPMAEFETENPPNIFSVASSESLTTVTGENRISETVAGPVYCGISLPKALAQFLTIVDRRDERRRKRGSLSFSEMEQVKEMVEEEKAGSSSSSDWSDADVKEESQSASQGVRSRRPRHDASQCLVCCTRVPKSKRQRKVSSSSFRMRTDTESSYGNAADGSPISLNWRLKATSEGGSGESFSCGEGEADPVYMQIPILSQARLRRDVIKHVGRMCNPVWSKSALSRLMTLKQSQACEFRDPCIYASACGILSSCTCRVSSRRFIQEMFLDVTFPQFYDDAESTLAQYAPSPTKYDVTSSSDIFKLPAPSSNKESSEEIHQKSTGPLSPVKNLSTVFEHFPACNVQSRQASSHSVKDGLPKT